MRNILSIGLIVEEDLQPAGIVNGSRALSKVLGTVLAGFWVTIEGQKEFSGAGSRRERAFKREGGGDN